MKNKVIFFIILLLLLAFLPYKSRADSNFSRISFKFSFGLTSNFISDLENVGENWSMYLTDFSNLLEMEKAGTYKNLNFASNYESEFMFNFSENIAIGIGVGYFQSDQNNRIVLRSEKDNFLYKFNPKSKTLFVNFTAYYFYSIFNNIKLYVKFGPNFHFTEAKISTFNSLYNGLLSDLYWEKTKWDLNNKSFGLNGSIGYEFDLGQNLLLFCEGKVTYCALKTWNGHMITNNSDRIEDENSGNVWIIEVSDHKTGKSYKQISINNEMPSDANVNKARRLKGEFRSFSFSVGLRIRL